MTQIRLPVTMAGVQSEERAVVLAEIVLAEIVDRGSTLSTHLTLLNLLTFAGLFFNSENQQSTKNIR